MPGRFETLGPAANLCACAVSEASGEDKMATGGTGPADWINYVIFRRGEEGFNGVGPIKMDIYDASGCVWLAATSI